MLSIKEIGKNPTFVFYQKLTKESKRVTRIQDMEGLATNKDRVIHLNIGLNQFSKEKTVIPKGYRKKKAPDNEWLKKYFYDPTRTPIKKKIVPELQKKYEWYPILDNGGTPFIVYISPDNKEVSVYTVPKEEYIPEGELVGDFTEDIKFYTKRLLHVKPQKVYIGTSPKNSMTTFSGGYGSKGNTVLLHMKGNEYILISNDIKFFKTKSPIVKYKSPVGNSSVPYPFAVDKNRNYYLLGFGVMLSDVPEKEVMKCSECICTEDCVPETVAQEPNRYFLDSKEGEIKSEKINITKRISSETY